MSTIESVLLKYFKKDELRETGDNYMTLCPFHDDTNPSFGVNKKTGVWHCFACGKSGKDIVSLVSLVENISYEKAEERVGLSATLPDSFTSLTLTPLVLSSYNYISSELPRDFKGYEKESETPQYLLNRLSFTTIRKFRLGYSKELPRRVVVPIVYNNRSITYIARSISEDVKPKYLYEKGFPISNYFFNYDAVSRDTTEVVLMEGVFSVMSATEKGLNPTLGVFGARELSNAQLNLLLNYSSLRKIILCYDNDEAGTLATNKCAKKLFSFYELFIMKLPLRRDANDCTQEELLEIYRSKKGVEYSRNLSYNRK